MKDISSIFSDIEGLIDLIRNDAPSLEELQKDAERLNLLTTFCQDLEKLIDSIIRLYSKNFGKTANSSDIINTLTELIPENDLSEIKTALSALVSTDWFVNNPSLSFNALADAVAKRILILHNPEINLKNMRRRLSLTELKLFEPEKTSSVESRRSRRSISQEITVIDQALGIAAIIKGKYIKAREERISIQLVALNKLIHDLPRSIRDSSFKDNTAAELLVEAHKVFQSLNQSQNLATTFDRRLEISAKCGELIKIILGQMLTVINGYLKSLKSGLTQRTFERLEHRLELLHALSLSLHEPLADMEAYSAIVEEFRKKYIDVVNIIEMTYHSLEEKGLREKETIAIQHIEARINPKLYFYRLNSQDLRESANSCLIELREAYHSEKIIIPTLEDDNLHQIYKDLQRGLLLNGFGYRHSKQHDGDSKKSEHSRLIKLNERLETEFGKANAANIILHYNQNTSYLVSTPLIASLNDESEHLVLQPYELEQTIYEEGALIYREMKTTSFRVLPQNANDSEDGEPWVFKCNILVQAWLSEEGFKVDAISTDSALVALAYMTKSSSMHLQKLIQLIVDIQRNYKSRLEQLEESIDYGLITLFGADADWLNKRQQLKTVLEQIKLFKRGEMTIDELIPSIARGFDKLDELHQWSLRLKELAQPYQYQSLGSSLDIRHISL